MQKQAGRRQQGVVDTVQDQSVYALVAGFSLLKIIIIITNTHICSCQLESLIFLPAQPSLSQIDFRRLAHRFAIMASF